MDNEKIQFWADSIECFGYNSCWCKLLQHIGSDGTQGGLI